MSKVDNLISKLDFADKEQIIEVIGEDVLAQIENSEKMIDLILKLNFSGGMGVKRTFENLKGTAVEPEGLDELEEFFQKAA